VAADVLVDRRLDPGARVGGGAEGGGSPVADLRGLAGRGPLWGLASPELNATLLARRPGEARPEHVNRERDILLVGLGGSGELRVDGRAHAFGEGRVALVERGHAFALTAGDNGLRYLSVHRRREGLTISRRAAM
jgi:quercetin dioxygenase-like cupin family protein